MGSQGNMALGKGSARADCREAKESVVLPQTGVWEERINF